MSIQSIDKEIIIKIISLLIFVNFYEVNSGKEIRINK